MMKTTTLQTPDAIRFYILWFWNRLQVGNYFCKGFTEPPMQKENHTSIGLKLKGLQRTMMGWNVEMRGEKNSLVCTSSNEQPWSSRNFWIREKPLLVMSWSGGRHQTLPPSHTHSLHFNQVDFSHSSSRSGVFQTLCLCSLLTWSPLLQSPSPHRSTSWMKYIYSLRPKSTVILSGSKPLQFDLSGTIYHDFPSWVQVVPLSVTTVKLAIFQKPIPKADP